jgi:energy-converting hydrogenase Eha subunit C
MTYQSGIDLVLKGRSPYEHSVFPYPPTVAIVGAWLLSLVGSEAFRTGFRYVNLIGGCAAVWASLLPLRAPWLLKLFTAILAVCFLPAFEGALQSDNLSMLTGGLTILALVLWPCRPVSAGILLGIGIALKPIALVALVLLAVQRPSDGGKKHWTAALAAFITVAALWSLSPAWLLSAADQPSVKAAEADWAEGVLNVSLFRVLACFGLKTSPFLLLAGASFVSILYLRTRVLNPLQFLCVACAASLLSLPIVWRHTLLIVTPLAFVAAETAFNRYRRAREEPQRSRDRSLKNLVELLFIVSGSITVLEASAYGVIGNWHPWVNAAALLIPITVIVLLTGYVVRFNGSMSRKSRS